MSNEKPSQLERLARARSTSDLTMDLERHRDVDVLIAAGIAESRNGLASAPLSRMYLASSRSSLRRAFESVHALVLRMSGRRRWGLTDDELKVVAKQATMHHIAPACPACSGRGYEVHEGAPVLSGKICKPCRGSGKRPIQKRLGQEITQVVGVLENIDAVTASAIARLLR